MRKHLLVLSCGALLIAACSSSDGGESSPTTTVALTSAVDADGRVLFAETVNAFVLNTVVELGEDGLDPQGAIHDAFKRVYPSLSFDGYAIEADGGSNISFWTTELDDHDVAAAENPVIVAVATEQVDGECFGSAVYGYPLPTEYFHAHDLIECTAFAVWEQLYIELT